MHCVVGGHFVDAQCSPQALFTGSVFLGKPWFIERYHSCGNVHTCLTLSNNRNHCRPAQVSLSRLWPKISKCWWWKILDKHSHIFASDLLNIASNLSNGMQQIIAMLVPCNHLNQNLSISSPTPTPPLQCPPSSPSRSDMSFQPSTLISPISHRRVRDLQIPNVLPRLSKFPFLAWRGSGVWD